MIIKTLGHYQITNQLGKGGMGEVFRAKDQKLGRDVAIKVLPEEFAKDADRVARFQREAKLLASLNHPNIAAIYGLEESEGSNFLVLELVEGETLADRVKKGPIPVEESLKLALQIAEALEAAHEKGVIHRDLKPANIKVTPDGKLKVLDFGLAKAYAREQEVNLSNSPTLSDAATQQGIILGTAAYMSPEQARGESVDRKADIWAFGVVLFEILTGRTTFDGRTVSDVLASVIKSEPEWKRLPPNLHPRIRLLLERCLEKEAKDRYSGISDARVDIQKILADPSGVLAQPPSLALRQSKLRLILPWITAVLGIVVGGIAVWKLKQPELGQVVRFDYDLPRDQQFLPGTAPHLAVSPDGTQFAYSTTEGLYLRQINEMDARLVPGTKVGQWPCFSPNGKWISYFSRADKKLMKIPNSGGTPMALCDVTNFGGASWDTDSAIVYGTAGGIMRISADGGIPEVIVRAEKEMPLYPQVLPNRKSVLFTLYGTPLKIFLQSIESGKRSELFVGDSARYLPTGHIIYASGNSLFAVPFDPGKPEALGGPVSVVNGVLRIPLFSDYAVSESGTLVYVPGSSVTAVHRTLVWVDRNGKEEPLQAPPDSYMDPRISPDGTKLALSIGDRLTNTDIWIWDLIRKTMTRLTFESTHATLPLWTPDGKRIVFSSHRDPAHGIYWRFADGTGKEERLASRQDRNLFPASWAGDRSMLLVETAPPGTSSFDIGAISMEGKREFRLSLQENYVESRAQVSPNGRWMAYASDESGRNEIHVRPFPDVQKGKWPVSTSGGDSPLWTRDSRELLYRNGDAVMAVSVKTDPDFRLEPPRILFRGTYVASEIKSYPDPSNTWDISPDGRRFLMIKEAGAEGSPRKINIVLNWLDELKQRVPVK